MIAALSVPVHRCRIGDRSGQAVERVISQVTGGHETPYPSSQPPKERE